MNNLITLVDFSCISIGLNHCILSRHGTYSMDYYAQGIVPYLYMDKGIFLRLQSDSEAYSRSDSITA